MWLSWQRIHLQWGRPGFNPYIGKIPWRRERLPTRVLTAWRIPWTVESMGSHRIGHDRVTFPFEAWLSYSRRNYCHILFPRKFFYEYCQSCKNSMHFDTCHLRENATTGSQQPSLCLSRRWEPSADYRGHTAGPT